MKWYRLNSNYIKSYSGIIIGKDYGSMGRSKPLYFVQVRDKIIEHGFNRLKDAKAFAETLKIEV